MAADSKQSAPHPVPLYARVGWLVVWATIVFVLAMMLRNCRTSIDYGSRTDQAQVAQSYQEGKSAATTDQPHDPGVEGRHNPVLHKAYNKGYREGLDQKRVK